MDLTHFYTPFAGLDTFNEHHLAQFLLGKLKQTGVRSPSIDLCWKTGKQGASNLSVEIGDPERGSASAQRYPITYRHQNIGEMRVHAARQSGEVSYHQLSKELALYSKRASLSPILQGELVAPLGCLEKEVGVTDTDRFLEMAGSMELPVLIEGEFGTEKEAVAYAIHYLQADDTRGLSELNCDHYAMADLDQYLPDFLGQSTIRTFVIRNIDKLDLDQQADLQKWICQFFGQPPVQQKGCRLIVTAEQPLRELVSHGRFRRELYSLINFLYLELPPAAARPPVLRGVIDATLIRYRQAPDQALSDQVVQALMEYAWPDNFIEVERTLAVLTSYCDCGDIELSHLQQTFPHFPIPIAEDPGHHLPPPQALIDILMQRDIGQFERYHPSLRRALTRIADDYAQPLSMEELAKSVFVSASHLSYLFKTNLGVTFKQVLSHLRIEHAKRLFDSPASPRVTQVSYDVGFGDLSHFEKVFRRYTSLSPREYRKRALNKSVPA